MADFEIEARSLIGSVCSEAKQFLKLSTTEGITYNSISNQLNTLRRLSDFCTCCINNVEVYLRTEDQEEAIQATWAARLSIGRLLKHQEFVCRKKTGTSLPPSKYSPFDTEFFADLFWNLLRVLFKMPELNKRSETLIPRNILFSPIITPEDYDADQMRQSILELLSFASLIFRRFRNEWNYFRLVYSSFTAELNVTSAKSTLYHHFHRFSSLYHETSGSAEDFLSDHDASTISSFIMKEADVKLMTRWMYAFRDLFEIFQEIAVFVMSLKRSKCEVPEPEKILSMKSKFVETSQQMNLMEKQYTRAISLLQLSRPPDAPQNAQRNIPFLFRHMHAFSRFHKISRIYISVIHTLKEYIVVEGEQWLNLEPIDGSRHETLSVELAFKMIREIDSITLSYDQCLAAIFEANRFYSRLFEYFTMVMFFFRYENFNSPQWEFGSAYFIFIHCVVTSIEVTEPGRIELMEET